MGGNQAQKRMADDSKCLNRGTPLTRDARDGLCTKRPTERTAKAVVASALGCAVLVALWADGHAQENRDHPAPSFEALREFARTAPLRAAVRSGDAGRVEELLAANPSWIDARDLEGHTPLHDAVFRKDHALVALLIRHGATIDATNLTAHTPLHLAAKNGDTALVSVLLSNHADLHLRCLYGGTPLFDACQEGHAAVVRLLMAHGGCLEGSDSDGDSALHRAAMKGHVEVAQLLLTNGINVNATNTTGQTPLHHAAANGHSAVVGTLLAHQADAAMWNTDFELPLELASKNRHEDIARRLRLHLAEVAARRPDKRLTVVVLPFHDKVRDPAHAHWLETLQAVLLSSLDQIEALRVLSESAGRHGFRQRNLKPGQAVTAEQARELGELVEAQRVVSGSLRRTRGQWQVALRVLNVATGKPSRELRVTTADWHDMRDQLMHRLVRELRVTVSAEERAEMRRRGTRSAEALEWYSKGMAALNGGSLVEAETCFRRALGADPQWTRVRGGLAVALGNQGNLDAAEQLMREVIALKPDEPQSHMALAQILGMKNVPAGIEKELRTALRLGGDASETLGEWHAAQGHWEAALHFWTEAERLDSTDAHLHGCLARGYANTGDRAAAQRELKEAERLAPVERLGPEDLNAIEFVARVHAMLGEFSQAVEHYERFIKLARAWEMNPEYVKNIETECAALKARLQATPVTAPMPREYSPAELQQALAAKLKPTELKLAINPLASTPEMRQWAQELTLGAQGDLAKARALFDGLNRRINPSRGERGARTAQEVFAAWPQPGASFICNEFAKLYVALARAVGLRAFWVHLEKDCEGRIVYHDCAAVFIDGRAWLVDPAYRWFGVPHRQFTVLDDVQAVAHQLGQLGEGKDTVMKARLCARLHAELPWTHVKLARALADDDRLTQATEALAEADRLEPERWDALILRGAVEMQRRNLDAAVELLRQGLKLNPDDGEGHIWLGLALRRQGKLNEARDELRASLRCYLSDEGRREAARELSQLNARLSAD